MATRNVLGLEERARRREDHLAGVVQHIGVYVIVNALFVFLDVVSGGDGLQWSPWIAGVWAIVLAFHVLAYLIGGRRLVNRRTWHFMDHAHHH